MPVNTITNNTAQTVTLIDLGGPNIQIPPRGSVHNAPITISHVQYGADLHPNRAGIMVNGDSYSITYAEGPPATVTFTGNDGVVTFT